MDAERTGAVACACYGFVLVWHLVPCPASVHGRRAAANPCVAPAPVHPWSAMAMACSFQHAGHLTRQLGCMLIDVSK